MMNIDQLTSKLKAMKNLVDSNNNIFEQDLEKLENQIQFQSATDDPVDVKLDIKTYKKQMNEVQM